MAYESSVLVVFIGCWGALTSTSSSSLRYVWPTACGSLKAATGPWFFPTWNSTCSAECGIFKYVIARKQQNSCDGGYLQNPPFLIFRPCLDLAWVKLRCLESWAIAITVQWPDAYPRKVWLHYIGLERVDYLSDSPQRIRTSMAGDVKSRKQHFVAWIKLFTFYWNSIEVGAVEDVYREMLVVRRRVRRLCYAGRNRYRTCESNGNSEVCRR